MSFKFILNFISLLNNNKIFNDKIRLQYPIILITIPCDINSKTPEFVWNLFLSEKNEIEQLKERFKTNINENKKILIKWC